MLPYLQSMVIHISGQLGKCTCFPKFYQCITYYYILAVTKLEIDIRIYVHSTTLAGKWENKPFFLCTFNICLYQKSAKRVWNFWGKIVSSLSSFFLFIYNKKINISILLVTSRIKGVRVFLFLQHILFFSAELVT